MDEDEQDIECGIDMEMVNGDIRCLCGEYILDEDWDEHIAEAERNDG